jgi:hypothetical protein
VPPSSGTSGIYQSTPYEFPEDVNVQDQENSGFMTSRKFLEEPCDRQLLKKFHFEKLIVAQLVNKLLDFYGVRSSITSLIGIRQQTLFPVS